MSRLIRLAGLGLLAAVGALSCGNKTPTEAAAATPAPALEEASSRGVAVADVPEIQRGKATNPKVTFGVDDSVYTAPEGAGKLKEHGCALISDGYSPKGAAGSRDLALVIGVGDYKVSVNGKSLDLAGPPNDAWKLVELLEGHFGFDKQNVCALTNDDATYANVHKALTALASKATKGDNVTIFFAGHGSQAVDWDGPQDEEDGKDETYMLHDSRAGEVMDLRDDEMNQYLFAIHQTGAYVTMIVDACNSGSASRDVNVQVVARQAIYAEYPKPEGYQSGNYDKYEPASMERLVYIAAARDGTSAVESGGEGYFTKAMIHSIQRGGGHPTWAQLPAAVQTLVSEKSNQLVTFSGDLNRRVFTSKQVERPLSWEITKDEPDVGIVTLKGPALPGWTEGATLDIYAGDLSVEDLKSSKIKQAKFKGTVKVISTTPFQAEAEYKASALASPLALGDVALLNTPGLTDKICVQLQKSGDGALSQAMASAVEGAITEHKDAKMTVGLANCKPDLLVVQEGDKLQIFDAQGFMRNEMYPPGQGFGDEAIELKAAQNLAQHARQRYLLSLTRGIDNVNGLIDVKVVAPPLKKDLYCVGETFKPGPKGAQLQEVPLCTPYALELTLTEMPKDEDGQPLFPEGIHVGVVALWNDSGVSVYPPKDKPVLLTEAGQTAQVRIAVATPPLNATDHIVVFGTPAPIDWSLMEVQAKRAGDDWPDVGPSLGSWTASYVGLTVQADPSIFGPDDDLTSPDVCTDRSRRLTAGGRKPCPE